MKAFLSTGSIAVVRGLFILANAVVLCGALLPPHAGPSLLPWDKAEHFAAFFGLLLLALPAFPELPLWQLAVLLCAEGGLIEILQGLPFIHRDPDIKDWLADSAGIMAVIAVILAGCLRAQGDRTSSPEPDEPPLA